MGGYARQRNWRQIQECLPADYQLTADTMPDEEWWPNRGHRIHLDTYRNPRAPLKVILLHGVGTNGRQLTTILGRPLARLGYETIAIDMPTFGVTEVAPDAVVTYDDWVQIAADLIAVEHRRDDRPVILFGLSAGGMEAIHAAELASIRGDGAVAGVAGMTFLDQQDPRVRRATAFDPVVTGAFGAPAMALLARTPARRLRIPMRSVSKMRALVNDRTARRACYRDRSSAGNSATVAFLDSYLNYRPPLAPGAFEVCPILLVQPGADRWTPERLSEPFLSEVTRVPVQISTLDNAGHYPLEQPGLGQLTDILDEFCRSRLQTG